MFEQSRRFHALPLETKTKIPYFDTGSFKSGYQPCSKDDYQRTNINIIAERQAKSCREILHQSRGRLRRTEHDG